MNKETNELSMQIALRIRATLRQLRLSQGDFADMADAAQSEVSKWLTGYHNFTIKTLERIQRVLGISFFNFDNQVAHPRPCAPCEFVIMDMPKGKRSAENLQQLKSTES